MKPFVFVTGMFRSGTTLLARMLNAHPQIAFASDPYARVFKAFRNAVAVKTFGEDQVDHAAPLDDYYFYPRKQTLMRQIQQTTLDLSTDNIDVEALQQQVKQASAPFSPAIAPHLNRLQGKTFTELFANGLNIIDTTYGNDTTQMLGFKEVWTGEFVPHLLETFPQAKVLLVVRDPRAVCASKNVLEEKYPWLFLMRQWRKLSTLAWIYQQPTFAHHDRVLVFRFEELIQDPETWIKTFCDFMNIEFHENLKDPTTFVDGGGKPWQQNSSHFEGKQTFNTKSISKWERTLTEQQIQFIETGCFAEMKLLGYERKTRESLPLSLLFEPPEIAEQDLANWIRPYAPTSIEALIQETALERIRLETIQHQHDLPSTQKRAFCLDEAFYDAAHHHCQQEVQ